MLSWDFFYQNPSPPLQLYESLFLQLLTPRLSKLHEVMALTQALKAGADEALMLDINGAVATCNSTNFFIVKNGEVHTSTGMYCMNGITRLGLGLSLLLLEPFL